MRPMPSPRGTNHAQLYLPSRGPQAAYDAALGGETNLSKLGGEMTGQGHPATIVLMKILDFLGDKVGPDDLSIVTDLANGWLSRDAGNVEKMDQKYRAEPQNAEDRKRRMASDARMAASSSNRADFDRRFPNAKRIGIV